MQSKRFWSILATIIVCVLTAVAVRKGYARYMKAQPVKVTLAAEAAFKKRDYQQASLLARRALQFNPDYLPACKLMADICEELRIPDAVLWRKLVVYLSGGSTESLIAYAMSAMENQEVEIARTTLARVPESERERADFHAVSGAIAFAAGNYKEAEGFYTEATRLVPQNQSYRFSLAKTQTSSEDFFTREAGRKLFASMIEKSAFELPSRRALILSYEAGHEIGAALSESRKLMSAPGHTFADEVLDLQILHRASDPRFTKALASAQEKAAKQENDSAWLLRWMSVEGLSGEAVEWAVKRAPAVSRTPAARRWLALAYLQLGDWPALQQITQQGSWEPVEYVRHAYRARAMHETGELSLARSEWKMAVSAATSRSASEKVDLVLARSMSNMAVSAGTDTEAISWLLKSSREWNMPDQEEQALWAAVEKPKLAREALSTLLSHYVGLKDTSNLQRVSAHLMAFDPTNETTQNNFAMFSLLRDQGVARASEVALKLYKAHPDNPTYVSTYAFALHCGGRSKEALRVLETLPSAQLEEPSFAAYYGIILAANRLREKAAKFLQLADDSSFLPEERFLVEKARAGLLQEPLKAP